MGRVDHSPKRRRRIDFADSPANVTRVPPPTSSAAAATKTSRGGPVKSSSLALVALLALGAALVIPSRAAADELKVGDKAPDFSLPGSDGKTYSLADFKGKPAVV